MASSKKAAEEFVKRWTGKGNEEQDKHLFHDIYLLRCFLSCNSIISQVCDKSVTV